MKQTMIKALKFMLCLLPVAALGGLFTGMYTYASYTEDVRQLLLAQIGSYGLFLAVVAMQSVAYAAFCGFFGYLLSDKLGLMRPFRFEKSKLSKALVLTAVCGVLFSLDYWTFAKWIPTLADGFPQLITPVSFAAAVLYGGIIEEVLMRLFLLSLLAFLTWKLFFRKRDRDNIPTGVFVAANMITAMVFAAGHLPTTVSTFGGLTPLLLIRCFLYNGGLGLAFGWLYRKYGVQYAMLSHVGCHILSKIIWIMFI